MIFYLWQIKTAPTQSLIAKHAIIATNCPELAEIRANNEFGETCSWNN